MRSIYSLEKTPSPHRKNACGPTRTVPLKNHRIQELYHILCLKNILSVAASVAQLAWAWHGSLLRHLPIKATTPTAIQADEDQGGAGGRGSCGDPRGPLLLMPMPSSRGLTGTSKTDFVELLARALCDIGEATTIAMGKADSDLQVVDLLDLHDGSRG
jgi:hypothetical protein